MEIKAYAKVNIGLDVVGTREDGYHLLDMVMQTVELHDDIQLTRREDDQVILTCDDPMVPTDDRNLAIKAVRALENALGRKFGVDIHLKKRIPSQAGLGGGSSDGAAVLKGVNDLFQLGLSLEQLATLAVKLGADVPYFLYGGTMRCQGIGEVLSILPTIPECRIVIVKPKVGMSTKYVYDNLDPNIHADMSAVIRGFFDQDIHAIASNMSNVLETVTASSLREINIVKEALMEAGALGVSMSGSGTAVFGIFPPNMGNKMDRGIFDQISRTLSQNNCEFYNIYNVKTV